MTLQALPLSADNFGADVWRANELGSASGITVASGHAVLDAQFPGGGWPVGALSEILQHHNGQYEWRLILPALMRAELGPVTVLVGAPHVPFGPGLAAHGFEVERLVWVTADAALERQARLSVLLALNGWPAPASTPAPHPPQARDALDRPAAAA